MNIDEKLTLNEVVETLCAVVKNKEQCYRHSEQQDNKPPRTFYVNRENHLESVIEWAINEIEGNIDLTLND